METLGLLALLCAFMAGAQTQNQKERFAGKFAKYMLYYLSAPCSGVGCCCSLCCMPVFNVRCADVMVAAKARPDVRCLCVGYFPKSEEPNKSATDTQYQLNVRATVA